MTRREFLSPSRKLVDEVTDWLCGETKGSGRLRTVDGAPSLAHLLVVVPTAQSGRSLRLSLAKKAAEKGEGGLLPPRIVMANDLLAPRDVRIATEAEELAVLAEMLLDADLSHFPALLPRPPENQTPDWALRLAKSILDVARVLGEGGIRMSEVRSAEDDARWRELACLEDGLVAALAAKGVLSRGEARRLAIAAGCIEKDIDEIVLPSAVDVTSAFVRYLENSRIPVTVLIHADVADESKFDAWGRPTGDFAAAIPPAAISASPTAVIEADEVAKFFRSIEPDKALPALVVCDPESYPELEGAFQNHFAPNELALRNPSRVPLALSSFGRILASVLSLSSECAYETFSTFVRMGDVARWAAAELGARPAEVASWVGALDAIQNTRLPRTLDDVIRAAKESAANAHRPAERAAADGLVHMAEAVKAALADPYDFLRRIFASLTLDESIPGDRELIAAAEVYRDLRRDCRSELVPDRLSRALELELLKSASYQLEPTDSNVLATNGWLEVSWCAEDELVFCGFNEGCVPENIVGHPFVPDSLRARLGLLTNDARARRDAFILARAVACRPVGAIRIMLHQTDGAKNVTKPSRLLFQGISDAALPALARRLYAVTKGDTGAPAKELPAAWRLALPFPPAGTVFRPSISVTALDSYCRCPFDFYLHEVFGEHADDRGSELTANEFGTLCHAALERFAKEGPKDSTDPGEIGDFLEMCVRETLMTFGDAVPTIVELQVEAAVARLRWFAEIQAVRRMSGWRIVSSEQSFSCTIKGCPTVLKGKFDRIDEHESTHELAVIDYKTWSRVDASRYDSVQLPVYRAMIAASGQYDPEKARTAKAFYCILAEHREDVIFDEAHACHEGCQSEAEDFVVAQLTRLARGIFYPPSAKSMWRRNYQSLVWESPERGIDPAWIADQIARKEEAE